MSVSDDHSATKSSSSSLGADFEVQKLKDLVKKLERQNQHLRHKTGKLSPQSKYDVDSITPSQIDSDKHSNSSNTQYDVLPDDGITEVELDKLEQADETSWLYVSPKTKVQNSQTSLEIWLRGELDHPSTPQLAMGRKNFLRKLESSCGYDIFKHENSIVELASPHLTTSTKYIPREQEEYSVTPKSRHVQIERQLFSPKENENLSPSISRNRDEVFHSPKHSMPHADEASSGHPVHHMPLPSLTMTSAHGLVPSSSVPRTRQRSSSPRSRRSPSPHQRTTKRDSNHQMMRASTGHYNSESPTRRPQMKTSQSERTASSPQTNVGDEGIRRSMPDMRRGRSSSPRPQVNNSLMDTATKTHSGISRLRASGLPRSQSPLYGSSGIDSNRQKTNPVRQLKAPSRTSKLSRGSYSEPNSESLSSSYSANSLSRSSTPRRSLPRPSQTVRNHSLIAKNMTDSVKKSRTSPNMTTELQHQELYSSPCGSESGSSDVWKDGEFY